MPTIFDAIGAQDLSKLKTALNSPSCDLSAELDKETPIQLAAKLKWWAGVAAIAQHLIDTKTTAKGEAVRLGSALYRAAFAKEWPTVKTLIFAGAGDERFWYNPENGETALHYAIAEQKEDVIALLAKNPANLVTTTGKCTSPPKTPIHFALNKNYWDGIRIIAEALNDGADKNGKYELGRALVIAVSKKKDVEAKLLLRKGARTGWFTNQDENTSLHWAVIHKNLDMVDTLLDFKAWTSFTNKDGLTPWQLAIDNGFWLAAERLLKNKKFTDEELKTASAYFLKAIKAGQTEVAQLCLDAGADVNACDDAGENAYHAAVRSGLIKAIHYVGILDKKFNLGSKNKNELTPIELAAMLGKWDCVQQLLWVQDKKYTPEALHLTEALHHAIQKGNYFIAKILIEGNTSITKDGASCNQINSKCGNIALYLAITHNRPEILQLLLYHGADPTTKNENGQDAYQLAETQSKCKVVLNNHRPGNSNIEKIRKQVQEKHRELRSSSEKDVSLQIKKIALLKELFELHKQILLLDLNSLKQRIINSENATLTSIDNNNSIEYPASNREETEVLINLTSEILAPNSYLVLVGNEESKDAQHILPHTNIAEAKDVVAYLNFGDAYRYCERKIDAFLRDLGIALASTHWQKKNILGKWIDEMPDYVKQIIKQLEKANNPVSSFEVLDIFVEIVLLLKKAVDNPPKVLGERTQVVSAFYEKQLSNAEFILLNLLPVKAFPAFPQLSRLSLPEEFEIGVPSNTGFFAYSASQTQPLAPPPPYPGLG